MKEKTAINPLMVDITDLQTMTGLSKNKAMELADKAGARVSLGIRRTLYNVQAIQYYINSRTGVEENDS